MYSERQSHALRQGDTGARPIVFNSLLELLTELRRYLENISRLPGQLYETALLDEDTPAVHDAIIDVSAIRGKDYHPISCEPGKTQYRIPTRF